MAATMRAGKTLDLMFRVEVQAGSPLRLRLTWDALAAASERCSEKVTIEVPTAPLDATAPEEIKVVQASSARIKPPANTPTRP
ncbi:hypothetical protein GCM10022631_13310 [Deinococcus rubellus]|uniref:hypothetical protein n=1 Tax=Deinococcus rubellus TaxID=1889240 RepID=UPI0031E60FF8